MYPVPERGQLAFAVARPIYGIALSIILLGDWGKGIQISALVKVAQ